MNLIQVTCWRRIGVTELFYLTFHGIRVDLGHIDSGVAGLDVLRNGSGKIELVLISTVSLLLFIN